MDTGDLLYSYAGVHVPNARKIGELRGDFYMKTYNLMGYDAFTPGELDFAFGVEEVLRLRRQANFPFLLANLLHASSSEPVFTPYLIKNVRGIQIGFIGLISNRLPIGGSNEEKARYRLEDPVETAKKWMAELKQKNCRVIVVVAHMDLNAREKLAASVPEIHFILSGHYTYHHLDSYHVNKTQIFMAGSRGENIGQVDLSLAQDILYARYRPIPLTPQYPDQAQIQELLRQYKNSLQSLIASQAQTAPRASPQTSRRYVVVPVNPGYMGRENCQACHPKPFRQWTGSAHARAYQTLVDKGQENDPLCLACHTTGYGDSSLPGGYLKDVQCEACHGPAEGHPDLDRGFPNVSEAVCLRCHNSANSPNFNYSIYRQKIVHPQ